MRLTAQEGGPSPRTWGELPYFIQPAYIPRTIPTHVGRTADAHGCQRETTDHPHARGENTARELDRVVGVGPSPRTWGELPTGEQVPTHARTIPTHVGRTNISAFQLPAGSDHPHARGENRLGIRVVLREHGPSPRTWGELPPAEESGCCGADHPHARGENASSFTTFLAIRGPSPRTWGELRSEGVGFLAKRTIPTHVGRTVQGLTKYSADADHPHARGENT